MSTLQRKASYIHSDHQWKLAKSVSGKEDRWKRTGRKGRRPLKSFQTEPVYAPWTLVSPALFCSGLREASMFKGNLNMKSAKWKIARHTKTLTLVPFNLQTRLCVLCLTIWKMDKSKKIQITISSAPVLGQLHHAAGAQTLKDHAGHIYPTRITLPP